MTKPVLGSVRVVVSREPDPVRSAGDILLVYKPSPWVTEPQHSNCPKYIARERHKVKKEAKQNIKRKKKKEKEKRSKEGIK